VDQYLVHWPLSNLLDGKIFHKPHHVIWPEIEECYELGLTKSIGVSNYNVQSLLNILSFCKIRPHVNQIEFSIYVQPWSLHEFGQKFDIVTVGYSNLARGGADVKLVLGNKVDLFNEPVLV
jgi:diketogulonate reductase-like aldo/keto reductase